MPENEITYEVVLQDLQEKFPNKVWNEESIFRWTCQTESIYIADPDSMVKFLEVPLNVVSGKVILPGNLYKLMDVYDNENKETPIRIRYNRQRSVLKQLIARDNQKYDKNVVWINFIGTALNSDCIPLIDENHYPACLTYCQIQGFEYEALYGEINMTVYMDWKQRFDGMIQGCKSDIRDWSSQDWEHMLVVMGNEIPRIGPMDLAHNFANTRITF